MFNKLLIFIILIYFTSNIAANPVLYGYGVKRCDELSLALRGAEVNDRASNLEMQRYRDWVTGFVSGLSLALGYDVLRGLSIDDAMQRIQTHCSHNPGDDVLNSTMNLVSLMEKIRNMQQE